MATTTNGADMFQQPQGQPQTAQTQVTSQNATALRKFQEETCTAVLNSINTMEEAGQLTLPQGYHAGNALKSAWLYVQSIETPNRQKVVDVCTKESICNCFLQMVTKGEHPQQHCYFIPYGNELTYHERYTGKLMRAKRDSSIQSVNAQVVYDGDTFVYTVDENGLYQLVEHRTALENIDAAKIKAAYAVVVNKDGSKHIEVMTWSQILKAWGQGATKGGSPAHRNFADQMAKRTVINRACKIALDSSTESMGDEFDNAEASRLEQSEAARDFANASLPHNHPHSHPHDGSAVNGAEMNRHAAAPTTDFDNANFEEIASEPGTPTAATATPSSRECPI